MYCQQEKEHLPFSTETCVICLAGFDQGSANSERVLVTEKGLKSLIHFSELRNDEDLNTYLSSCLCSQPQGRVNVHKDCRKDYTNPKRLPKSSDQDTECGPSAFKQPKLRSSQNVFNWQTDCFLCGKCAGTDDHSDHSNIRHSCFIEFRQTLLSVCDQRNDSWAFDVRSRLLQVFDLPAADAVYHKTCYSSFYSGWQKKEFELQESRGRHTDTQKMHAFNLLCDWLEIEGTGELYTLDELCEQMRKLTGKTLEVYSAKSLKQKLTDKYGEHVFFAEIQGRKNVVCFRDMANFIISQIFHSEKKRNPDEEIHHIITSAAKLIKAQTLEKVYDTTTYPTKEDIENLEQSREWLPPTLQLFLCELLKSPLKQLSIGQCLLHAMRPRSVIPPVPLGLGIELACICIKMADKRTSAAWIFSFI